MSIKLKTAREYRVKFPKTPTLTLARIMYNENADLFKDVEDARDKLRYAEGKKGEAKKKHLKDKSLVIDEPRPYNPFKLPESEEADYKPFILKGHKKIGLLYDVHVPYHSIEALTVAIEHCKKQKIDGLILAGDFLDCYQVSRWERDPRKRSLSHEIEAAKQVLGILKKELKCRMYWLLGNHEERYQKYLIQKAPELLGISDVELQNIMKLKDYNCEIIDGKRIIKANKLNIIHGHEFVQSIFSPVNIARGLYTRAKVSAIQGHSHQTSSHTETDMNGDITTTWSVGCLSELHPLYMPLNRWNHGFAIVDLGENGVEYSVQNKRIYQGKIL